MAKVDGTLAWLVDEQSGRVVGQKLPDGTEVGVVTTNTDQVTGRIGLFLGGRSATDNTPALSPPQMSLVPMRNLSVIDTCQAGWTNHSGVGTVSIDTAERYCGTSSVRIAAGGSSSTIAKRTLAANVDLTNKAIGLQIKIKDGDLSDIDQLIFYAMDSSATAWHAWVFARGSNQAPRFRAGEWQTITLTYAGGSITGTDPRDAVRNIRCTLIPVASKSPTVWLGQVFAFDAPASGAVCLTFDDGYSEWMDAARKMAQYGYSGTGFIVSELLDTPGFLTTSQVHELRDKYGWEIGMHGDIYWQSAGPNGVSDVREWREYMAAQRAELVHLGAGVGSNLFAYPGGQQDFAIQREMRRLVSIARTIDNTLPETIPPANWMAVAAASSITDNVGGLSIASALSAIDSVIAHKALYIPVFHRFGTYTTGTTICSWASFDAFLAGLKSRNAPVRLLGDVAANG